MRGLVCTIPSNYSASSTSLLQHNKRYLLVSGSKGNWRKRLQLSPGIPYFIFHVRVSIVNLIHIVDSQTGWHKSGIQFHNSFKLYHSKGFPGYVHKYTCLGMCYSIQWHTYWIRLKNLSPPPPWSEIASLTLRLKWSCQPFQAYFGIKTCNMNVIFGAASQRGFAL